MRYWPAPRTFAAALAADAWRWARIAPAIAAVAMGPTALVQAQTAPSLLAPLRATTADFGSEPASAEARAAADRALESGDHQGLVFAIVDKQDAKVFVFDKQGRLLGAAPALVGAAVGDTSVPGIGDRPLSSIRPEERTTPAGRFFASLDRDLHGEEVLWVDYEGGVALHRMSTAHTRDRRSERLATPTPADNRITYGCINVAARFYEQVVSPAFKAAGGIVYVLPETPTGKALASRPGPTKR